MRERRKAETRRAIGRAARDLVLAEGFEAATVERIAHTAGVSRRTFFRYFPTKEDAFFAENAERLERFDAAVRARLGRQSAWAAVRDSLLDVSAELASDRAAWLAWRAALRSSPRLVAADVLEDARWAARLAAFLVADGLDPWEADVRAGAVMGVVRAVLVGWSEAEAPGDLVTLGRRAFEVLARGLDG